MTNEHDETTSGPTGDDLWDGLTAASTTPVWSLDPPVAPPTPPVRPLDPPPPVRRLIPEGRRAAAPAPESPEDDVPRRRADSASAGTGIDERLTAPEREALARADRELVAALHEVVLQRASDLHITVGAPPTVRVDGGLRPAGSVDPWNHDRTREALLSLLSDAQRDKFQREHELDFAFTISVNARFRVNLYQQRGSYGG